MAKKALLIGINRYKIPGADLRGCVNDVNNLRGILTESYGFKGSDITVLTDFDATKAAMQAGIKKLVATPGVVLVQLLQEGDCNARIEILAGPG